jgi:hypothetical protein
MLACESGQTATAQLLIAKGVDVEAKDKVRPGVVGAEWEGLKR